jgi:hypothetical protein
MTGSPSVQKHEERPHDVAAEKMAGQAVAEPGMSLVDWAAAEAVFVAERA